LAGVFNAAAPETECQEHFAIFIKFFAVSWKKGAKKPDKRV